MKRFIKFYSLTLYFFWCPIVCFSHTQNYTKNVIKSDSTPELTEDFLNRMCFAIWKAEGGEKARKPYGVLSIPVRDEAHARQITLNSIRNNWKRWEKAGRPGDFVDFMANRWCPPSADPQGNRNWKKNVKYFLSK